MKRRVYFKAFITPKCATKETGPWPRYEWYQDVVDVDDMDEAMTDVQTEHMANRLVGAYRHIVPFAIEWIVGDIYQLDYQI